MDHLTVGQGNEMAAALAGDDRALQQIQQGKQLLRNTADVLDTAVRIADPLVDVAEDAQQGKWVKAGVGLGMMFVPGDEYLKGASGLAKTLRAGDGTTYEIIAGVRRSKAAHMTKKERIVANILAANGNFIEAKEVPLSALRSPKNAIDVKDLTQMERFAETLEQTRRAPLPPERAIDITPGSRGTAIQDVIFDYGK